MGFPDALPLFTKDSIWIRSDNVNEAFLAAGNGIGWSEGRLSVTSTANVASGRIDVASWCKSVKLLWNAMACGIIFAGTSPGVDEDIADRNASFG